MQYVLRPPVPSFPVQTIEQSEEERGNETEDDERLQPVRGLAAFTTIQGEALLAQTDPTEMRLHEPTADGNASNDDGIGVGTREDEEDAENQGWFVMPNTVTASVSPLYIEPQVRRQPPINRGTCRGIAVRGRLQQRVHSTSTGTGRSRQNSCGNSRGLLAFLGSEFEATATSIQTEVIHRWKAAAVEALTETASYIVTGASLEDTELQTAVAVLGTATAAVSAINNNNRVLRGGRSIFPIVVQPLLVAGTSITGTMLIARSALRSEGRLRFVLHSAWKGVRTVSSSIINSMSCGSRNAAEIYVARLSVAITSIVLLTAYRLTGYFAVGSTAQGYLVRWKWLFAVLWSRLVSGCATAWRLVDDIGRQVGLLM